MALTITGMVRKSIKKIQTQFSAHGVPRIRSPKDELRDLKRQAAPPALPKRGRKRKPATIPFRNPNSFRK